MWLIKRTLVDGWELDRAMEEATLLGLTNENLKQFAIGEIRARQAARRRAR
jgi:hypothetical protein